MRPSRSWDRCTCSRLPLQCGSLLPAREMSIRGLTLPARRVTLVLAGCLYVKYRQRVLWFVRMHRGTGGTYLVVHYSNGWTAMFLLFLGVLQGYIWCGKSGQTIEIRVLTAEVALGKPSSTIRGSLPSTRTCGVKSSGCPAGPPSGSPPGASPSRVSMLFSRSGVGRLTLKQTSFADILHLDSSGRPARSFFCQAWFTNTCALLAPVLLSIVVAVLAWEAHRHYHESLVAYGAIEGALAAAARSL